jgi:hypothetical protein
VGYFDGLDLRLLEPEAPPPEKSGFLRRVVGDTAVSAVKSAIGLPEMAAGLGSLVSGGRVGKAAEEAGFRPREAREFLDTLLTPEQQAANREVQQAQGFWDTASAAIRNPSTIGHAVVESAPSLLPAGAVARGVMAGATRLSPALAGRIAAAEAAPLVASQGAKTAAELTRLAAVGIGEGVVSAGASAEQIRQQTQDGRLTAEQSLIAAGSGALTGLIGGVAGKIANKLGIGDVQQMLAGVQQAGPKAEKALTRALLEGFATEGVLQELPQSAQEQIAQNVALGKPWDEGVGNAAAMGTLAGGVMGVGGAAIGRMRREPEQPAPVDPLTESNARADAAMERLATTNDVGQMIDAAREIATATPLSITEEQEARVMQAGEELAKADLTDMKNMGRLDKTQTRGVEQPAPIVPASEEGPAPFLDRLLTATEALQDPAVRQRVEQAAGPQYLAQLDQYAEVANTPGFMDGIGDQVRDRHLELLERAVFPERFRKPAPQIQRAERRRSDPVPIEPFRVAPVTDPVLDYVEAKRAENTMAARAFVKEFEAGRITRRDVVRAMQTAPADPLGSNPNPLADLQPAEPAPNLIQQRLQAAAGQERVSGGFDLEATENALTEERDRTSNEIEDGWLRGGKRRRHTKIEAAIYDAVTASTVGPEEGKTLFDTAISEGRLDLAEYVVERAERAAAAMGTTPGTSPGSPKYEAIKQDLERRKAEAAKAVAAMRAALNNEKAGQAQPSGIQIEPSRARPKGQSDERNPERAVPGEGRPVDTGNQPGTSGVVSGELQQPGAPGPAGTPVPSAVQGVDAERAGRGLGDDALSSAQAQAGTPAEGAGTTRPTPGQAQQGERTYDQIVDEELAQTRQRYTEAGKVIGLTFEQFMQDVEDGRRSGHSVKEAREQLPAMRADLEAVKAGRKPPRSVVGVGGTKAQAVKWTEGQIKRLADRIATGGQSEPTNRSNYNRTLRDILDGKDQQAKKPAEQAAPAAQAPAKKLPFVNKEDGARLFGKKPPAQSNQQDRLRDARAIGKKAAADGQPRTPPTAFTALERQVWRAGWDEGQSTGTATPQVQPATPTDTAANQAATSTENDLPEPTQAQKEAGNYKVGRIKVSGLDISVENPAGSERAGIDPDGKKWRNKLAHHYGYIRRSEGADGDHVDVFVNPGTPEDYDGQVFVVDQADPKTGRWDEHKVMMGFPSAKAAQEAYQANYAKDWTGLRAVQPMTMEQFKAWVSDPRQHQEAGRQGREAGQG